MQSLLSELKQRFQFKQRFLYVCLLVFTLTSLFSPSNLQAQDVMMQGWYWQYPKSPTTTTNFAVTLKNQMIGISDAGFTHIWLPPLSRASFGGFSNGYDPQDLFDLGEFGQGSTGFGSRSEVDQVIGFANALGMTPIADVIYNHRDGGAWEDNSAVEGWIENLDFTKVAAGDQPFPSDRWRCYLPVGGTSGNEAGDYYIKVSSASQHPNFHDFGYSVYMWTNRKPSSTVPVVLESEPNGGGDCGEPFDDILMAQQLIAQVDPSGCTVDEFKLALGASEYFTAGDTIWIELRNSGAYSDHRIYSLWSANRSMDIQSEIKYQTATNFNNLPSGRGGMDWQNFKPNGNPTSLGGDLDYMWFFYDYDNTVSTTRDTLYAYTKWLWEDVNIRGFRLDAVKHFPADFLGDMMSSLHAEGYTPPMVVGEFFDFNSTVVSNWINDVESSMSPAASAAIDIRAFDFGLRGALKEACDNPYYDLRNVYQSGLVNSGAASGFQAVTFVNNHDYIDAGEPMQNDPMLAYAYILTNNHVGMPCVYYPDYFGINVPNAPNDNLKAEIDALIQLQQDYISGSSDIEYLNRFGTPLTATYFAGSPDEVLLYQLTGGVGGKDVLVAINFSDNALDVNHQVNTTWMDLVVGDTLTAVAGNSETAFSVIDGSSQLSIQLPGRSYAVWVNCSPASPPQSLGDINWCPDDPFPTVAVLDDGRTFNWYDASTGGTLLQADSPTYTPSAAGTFYVQATGDGCGNSERVAVSLINDPTSCPCAVPSSISETVTGPTSVSLMWDVVADAFGYQLEGHIVGTSGWANIKTTSVGKNIGVLQAGTSYEWRMRSFCNPEFSNWSSTRIFTTPSSALRRGGEILLFPSPASEMLSISLPIMEHSLETSGSLEIVNLLGKVVLKRALNTLDDPVQIDLKGFADGMYFLTIQRGQSEWSANFEVLH